MQPRLMFRLDVTARASKGQRTIVETLFKIAEKEPSRVFLIPRGDKFDHAFRDVTFDQLAEPVDACAWFIKTQCGISTTFETLVYLGINDFCYVIGLYAAIKCGYTVGPPSKTLLMEITDLSPNICFVNPRYPDQNILHIMDSTNSAKMIYSVDKAALVARLQMKRSLQSVELAPPEHWLAASASQFPFEKTWWNSKEDPVLTLHSSGTTGFPKPITLSNAYFSILDRAYENVDGRQAGAAPLLPMCTNGLIYSPLPLCHILGVVASNLRPLFGLGGGSILPLVSSDYTSGAELAIRMIEDMAVTVCVMPPLLVDILYRLPSCGAVVSDLWAPESRGKALSVYTSGIMLGPVLAPLYAGFVAQYTTWRWVFWATSIADAAIQFAAFLLLRETCAPVLLRRRASHTRKQADGRRVILAGSSDMPRLSAQLSRVLTRVVRMLLQQPIVQIQALYMAHLHGTCYLLLSTFAELWTDPGHYGYSTDIAGLQYISIGVGYAAGLMASAWMSDRIYRYLQVRSGKVKSSREPKGSSIACAEYRLPLMLPASLSVPIGLYIYGWAGQYTLFWLVPDIGMAIFGIGAVLLNLGVQAYIIEACGEYAASGLAASAFLRSLAACTFPLFANQMYDALGLGWGNSLLAFVSIGIGIPAIVFLWIYRARIRARKSFAG
ncbi:putative AMP-dependent synthetase/ligase, major facilitator superfamily, MFS transporter superfamily [Septoria linicola]|nr:putative AMP-dependent synthetase/ligase, major facilitator superfamily, MFS transporter superfamily [Septoria linicola]